MCLSILLAYVICTACVCNGLRGQQLIMSYHMVVGNLGSLKELPVLFTAEPSLQPLGLAFFLKLSWVK